MVFFKYCNLNNFRTNRIRVYNINVETVLTILAFFYFPMFTYADKILSIGLLKGVNTVTVSNKHGIYAENLDTAIKSEVGNKCIVQYYVPKNKSVGYLKLGNELSSQGWQFTPKLTDDSIKVGTRHRYRGSITVKKYRKFGLLVTNEVELEEYLYGVIAREMGPDWPEQALLVQSIVARTYAISECERKHQPDGYDLCDRYCCQVYYGTDAESRYIRNIVDDTAGQIVVFQGIPIVSYYHHSCGGYTQPVGKVWDFPTPPPYLQGVKCKYCIDYHRQGWSYRVTKKWLTAKLKNKGYAVGIVNNLTVEVSTITGRVITVKIKHSTGNLKIPAHTFRMKVGGNSVRSTMFTVTNLPKEIVFRGRGWGHGVGLCQWGTRVMAEQGYKHHQIIQHYFPGTKIIKLPEEK